MNSKFGRKRFVKDNKGAFKKEAKVMAEVIKMTKKVFLFLTNLNV